ncbi:MAG: glycosyltransferase [Pyrinomonadaceae bacterium]
MKIFRIIARLNVGGPARHVVWLTKDLQSEEFQSVLVAGTVPDGEENMDYFASENDVSPHYISELSRELSVNDLVSIIKVYRRIRAERPDIVHTHTAKAGTVGRIAAFLYKWMTWKVLLGRPRRVRSVHTFHGHVFHNYYGKLKTSVFLLIERALARFATDRIIVISPQQFDEIHNSFRVGRLDQFAIIPLGVDLRLYTENAKDRDTFRSEIGVDPDEIVVGLVGRMTAIKNLSLFLETAEIYYGNRLSNGSPPLKFVLIGDGYMREALEREVEKRGITDIFQFLGNRNDPEMFYSGLDIVALTSLNEGTPLSLIEGMAAGRPVISTAVGGVTDLLGEILTDYDDFRLCRRGVSVDSGSAKAFYQALIFLATDERLRENLAAVGRDFVNANYGKERLVTDIKDLYRDLMKN